MPVIDETTEAPFPSGPFPAQPNTHITVGTDCDGQIQCGVMLLDKANQRLKKIHCDMHRTKRDYDLGADFRLVPREPLEYGGVYEVVVRRLSMCPDEFDKCTSCMHLGKDGIGEESSWIFEVVGANADNAKYGS